MLGYDFTEVVKLLLEDKVPDRMLLLNKIREEMLRNRVARHWQARLMETVAEHSSEMDKPSDLLLFALRHGCLLGILLEREAQERRRSVA